MTKTTMNPLWLASVGLVAMGCTTNVTDNAPLPSGSSTILGSAPATAALLVDSTTVTWVTADGAIYSCTKGDCHPRSIATNYGSLGASFNGADSSAVVAQGEIYFIASNTLQSCPLSGCSTPTVLGNAAGPRVVTDGNSLAYYAADMKGLSICSLPACSSPTVVQPAMATIGIDGFALANGVLSFLSSPAVMNSSQPNLYSLEYCQADACPSGLQTAWQEMLPSGDPSPVGTVMGANQTSVFFTSGEGELMRCDLPTCASPVDMGVKVNEGSIGLFSGTDIFMGTASFSSNTPASWMHCSLEQCDPSPIPYPDPVLAALCPPVPAPVTGGPPQFGTLPFAVDAANFYWATGSIYKSTGNLIVSTAR